ncbi:ATP-binding protein [Streptantibioticus silvisoli]|uniref:ATP-binding protein n=1 Tax=Streptantibioticus silvisoli TaxID=2705255 RepID=A0ABT6VZN4_9ACTN|nr:ATP-binding protein [Streptantibioticus silvisoli]MDI5963952.1 ATP-binding protein [Streptantibioticus silvisoli]
MVAAYHRNLASGGRPLLMSWSRTRAGGPVTVLCATTPAARTCPTTLTFPPGTRGRPLAPAEAAAGLAAHRWWSPLAGTVDALLPLLNPDRTPSPAAGLLEESLLGAWQGPFAWLLLAYPVPPDELEREAARLAAAERDARARGSSPDYTVRAERLARLHRETRAARSTGMWRTHLLAGGPDPGAAAGVAGLLIAGLDLTATPYALAPLPPVDGLATALDTKADNSWSGGDQQSPFLSGSFLLSALAQVPGTEVPGVRMVERSTFDVTPEAQTVDEGVELGHVLDHDDAPTAPLPVALTTLNRHAFVCGATGAGKSQSVRTLLEALSRRNPSVPWLVIEPAKSEYARMAGRLRGHDTVLVIRPGDPDVIPACLNPLEPEPGFPLQTHIDLVRALFLAAFEAAEPFPQVLAHALTRCYREAGWDVTLSEPINPTIEPRYPTLGDLRRAALQVVEEIGYSREITDNVRGFIDVRIASLRLGTPGRFFEGGHPLDMEALLERNVVLELEDIGNDQDKAFFIGAVLLRITEHLRHRATAGPVRLHHVTVIEEAHRLLRHAEPGSPAAHAVELFAGLLAEIRAYGEGVVVAEQIPSKIIPDVIKNSAVKIVHRLPAEDDRDTVGATMNLTDEQSRHLVTLPSGRAAVFTDGMDRPLLTAMPLREDTEDATHADHVPPVQPRSVACGPLCQARPCTLREITEAGRLADDARLTLWLELLTVAHLAGEPSPKPDPDWLAGLRERSRPRTLQCAVAHRVHTAVETRHAALALHYDPAGLAAHLVSVARGQLAGAQTACDGAETNWQAGPFRWVDICRALVTATTADRPHPDTAAWRRRGLDLPGATTAQQFRAFECHPDNRKPASEVTAGHAVPAAVDVATALLDGDPDPAVRLKNTLSFLHLTSDWPNTRLYGDVRPAAPAKGSS